MNHGTKRLAYYELAWTEPILAPPDEYTEETELLINAINEHSANQVRTLLHLGCGSGGNDYTFKRHYRVTGVDISPKMLEIARDLNLEAVYHHGDMRKIELGELFDAVVVPESIDYMRTENELYNAMITAQKHLKPGGVFLVVANIAEQFSQNNFVYTGCREDIEITLFENNYIPAYPGTTYEATLVYLIRREGKLEIYSDRHILGLFKLQTWLDLLKKAGFDILNQTNIDHAYDRFIAGEGKYPRLMFVGRKQLR
ncbi:MAG: class I SAM-dependent methyltransferase [Dehalococcoidia bacterium]